MKIYLSLITAAALSLAACGGESKAPAAPAAPEASAPAASAPEMPAASAPEASAPAAASMPAVSAECSVTVNTDDTMKYDPKDITVKSSCAQFAVTLKNNGKIPAASGGHNIVITKSADAQAVLKDGAEAGAAANYVKAGDERVVAHTKLLSGGEEDTVVFDTSKLAKGESYEFFCSFPGHYAQMNGKIVVAE